MGILWCQVKYCYDFFFLNDFLGLHVWHHMKSKKRKEFKWTVYLPTAAFYFPYIFQTNDFCLLILTGDLYMVPFVLLKGASTPPLHERFTIRTVPSIRALNTNLYWENRSLSSSGMTPAVVIGNPLLPKAVTKRWKWGDIPNSERVRIKQ